jgi:hypothetical protein
MVIMRACGRVEQRINSKLSECLTGDVDLVPIQQGWSDDRVEDGECTSRAAHTPASAS